MTTDNKWYQKPRMLGQKSEIIFFFCKIFWKKVIWNYRKTTFLLRQSTVTKWNGPKMNVQSDTKNKVFF